MLPLRLCVGVGGYKPRVLPLRLCVGGGGYGVCVGWVGGCGCVDVCVCGWLCLLFFFMFFCLCFRLRFFPLDVDFYINLLFVCLWTKLGICNDFIHIDNCIKLTLNCTTRSWFWAGYIVGQFSIIFDVNKLPTRIKTFSRNIKTVCQFISRCRSKTLNH